MQVLAASDIKKNSSLMQNALREDLLITKRNKPYVVIMDYQRYQALLKQQGKRSADDWIDRTFGSMDAEDAEDILESIYESRVDKKIDTAL